MPHPLSTQLTRAAEAAGALRALLLALDDERTSDADRAALRVMLARITTELITAHLSSRYLARTVATLAATLTRDEPRPMC